MTSPNAPDMSQEDADLELIARVIEANPPTNYSYVAQNRQVEQDRAKRYARMIAVEALKEKARD
jgi:hypothetical protein